MSIVRWRHLPHTLLLFFFSGRDGVGTADELTLPFGFPVVVAATSTLRFALFFGSGGEGAGSSSSSDLTDESVSASESLDWGVFCANLVL